MVGTTSPNHHTPLARRCCWLKAAINALETPALETIHWCALKRHVTCLECRAESALMNNPNHLSNMRQLKTSLKPDSSQHSIFGCCTHGQMHPHTYHPSAKLLFTIQSAFYICAVIFLLVLYSILRIMKVSIQCCFASAFPVVR